MGKPVRLTYRDAKKKTFVEECTLIEEDDEFLCAGVPIELDDGGDIKDKIASQGYVMFEDEEGVFVLHPTSIIEIKEI